MGKLINSFVKGLFIGALGVLAYLVGVAASYVMGLASTLIGLALFAWIMPDTVMDNLPRAVLASVILLVPFIYTATGTMKASITTK